MQKGDIYLATFELPHIATVKTRPVIVLQCDEDNKNLHYPFVIVAPVPTRKIDRIYQQDVFLPAVTSGLERDSKILLGALTTFLKFSLTRRIGRVGQEVITEIDLKILRLFGLLDTI